MSSAHPSYKAFVSYRREGGIYIARALAGAIVGKGFATFIDLEELRGGDFNSALDEIIEETPNFILVVSRGAFDRIGNEGDWMRRELASALRHHKRVVPVFEQGVSFPDEGELPPEVRSVVRQNGVQYSPQFHNEAINKIISHFDLEICESALARRQRIADYYKSRMIAVPGGGFLMGSDRGRADELPIRHVHVSGFWMMKYPMTQREYQALLGINPANFLHPDKPVQNVSWFDAVRCCNKWSERDGLEAVYRFNDEYRVDTDFSAAGYRLPTEAEWEYACRAGSQTRFHWGDSEAEWDQYAWHDRNSDDQVHVVGRRRPNAWGLHDITGQVYEWCNDWYEPDYYRFGEVVDPMGPPGDFGEFKVMRGGAWAYDPLRLRSAARLKRAPQLTDDVSGFRCVINRPPIESSITT